MPWFTALLRSKSGSSALTKGYKKLSVARPPSILAPLRRSLRALEPLIMKCRFFLTISHWISFNKAGISWTSSMMTKVPSSHISKSCLSSEGCAANARKCCFPTNRRTSLQEIVLTAAMFFPFALRQTETCFHPKSTSCPIFFLPKPFILRQNIKTELYSVFY